jgi:hypothetical protein
VVIENAPSDWPQPLATGDRRRPGANTRTRFFFFLPKAISSGNVRRPNDNVLNNIGDDT